MGIKSVAVEEPCANGHVVFVVTVGCLPCCHVALVMCHVVNKVVDKDSFCVQTWHPSMYVKLTPPYM